MTAYGGEDADLRRLERAMAQAESTPAAFPEVETLAEAAGVGVTKLKTLFRDHAHQQPAAFLQRIRIQRACAQLVTGPAELAGLAFDSGYESASGFHEAFRRQTGLSPGTYRTMLGATTFT